jgi:hypothetical protein
METYKFFFNEAAIMIKLQDEIGGIYSMHRGETKWAYTYT